MFDPEEQCILCTANTVFEDALVKEMRVGLPSDTDMRVLVEFDMGALSQLSENTVRVKAAAGRAVSVCHSCEGMLDSDTAEKLRAQGKKVPGFLLRPHEPGHIPPLQALPSLADTLRAINPESPTLRLVSADPWGEVHPAPPRHQQHLPPHLLAMQMQREIDLGTGEAVMTPGEETVIRHGTMLKPTGQSGGVAAGIFTVRAGPLFETLDQLDQTGEYFRLAMAVDLLAEKGRVAVSGTRARHWVAVETSDNLEEARQQRIPSSPHLPAWRSTEGPRMRRTHEVMGRTDSVDSLTGLLGKHTETNPLQIACEPGLSRIAEEEDLDAESMWERRGPRLVMTFLLNVMGGCGAVWGCSEAAGVRAGENNDWWRAWSVVAGVGCLGHWVKVDVSSRRPGPDASVLATILLQVLGGAGAVWGALEMLGLRLNYPPGCRDKHIYGDPTEAWAPGYEACSNTYRECRWGTLAVLLYFAWRWWSLGGGLTPPPIQPRCTACTDRHQLRAWVHWYVGTFVLEVCGGAGAMWGCAEVAGVSGHSLRLGWGDDGFGQESFDLWRMICSGVFCCCLARWVCVRVLVGQPAPIVGAPDEIDPNEHGKEDLGTRIHL
eukprot:TRINITY_DN48970_c0_g1_i1.p1 TRINITY_DN48970_c0_g1~~TRINITY_DN48970_c0_g1_i1.p1  ORF type:complete len:604 (+),score=97.88 TRINITY_DN48970_c0_g1_i1:379-2190(+)